MKSCYTVLQHYFLFRNNWGKDVNYYANVNGTAQKGTFSVEVDNALKLEKQAIGYVYKMKPNTNLQVIKELNFLDVISWYTMTNL